MDYQKIKDESDFDSYSIEEQSEVEEDSAFPKNREKRFNLRKTLAKDQLLEGVVFDPTASSITLVLKNEFKQHENIGYKTYKMIYDLYQQKEEFKEKFHPPKMKAYEAYIRLKKNHGYPDGEAVLKALIKFSNTLPEKTLKFKELLINKQLLERVEMDGYKVNLILKPLYNSVKYFFNINRGFANLYKGISSEVFTEKFEKPEQSRKNLSSLTLKSHYGIPSNQVMLDLLINAVKQSLNRKNTPRIKLKKEIINIEMQETSFYMPSYQLRSKKRFGDSVSETVINTLGSLSMKV